MTAGKQSLCTDTPKEAIVKHEGRIKMLLDGPNEGDWVGYCTGCDWHIEPRPIDHTLGEAAREHEWQESLSRG